MDREFVFGLANMSIGSQDPEYQIEGDGRGTGQKAQREYFEYLNKVVAGCRKNPGDDLMSALLRGEVEGEGLTDSEMLFNCFLFIVAGQETTRNAISGGMLALLQNPDQLRRLNKDRSLMPTAVEEILRYASPVHAYYAHCHARRRNAWPEDSRRRPGGNLERLGQSRRNCLSRS